MAISLSSKRLPPELAVRPSASLSAEAAVKRGVWQALGDSVLEGGTKNGKIAPRRRASAKTSLPSGFRPGRSLDLQKSVPRVL